MNQADLFRNLLIMAAVDGRMSEAELRLLTERAAEWDISDDQFEDAIQDAISGDAELTIPTNGEDRSELLKEMIRMMAADGCLAEQQKKLLAVATTALGVNSTELNELIDSLLDESI